jgi:2-iminoacetate synthase ThiH
LANGQPITHTTVTNTDKVKVSPIQGCAQACHFCDTPYTERYNKNGEERVIESIEIALRDAVLPGKHILIWGGTPKPEDYAYENAMYAAIAAAFSEIPVEVMNVPMPGFLDAQELYDAGVDSLCINLELYNEDLAKKLMPNKFKASREGYFKFFEQATKIFGEGKVQSYLLVGLESMEELIQY